MDEYMPVLRKTLEEAGAEGIQEVVITHHHIGACGPPPRPWRPPLLCGGVLTVSA